MRSLYDEGLSVTKIARREKVSYLTAYGYTKVKEKGFESQSKYLEHLAEKRQQRPLNQALSNLIKKRLTE